MSTKELMLLNCGVGEGSWESLGLQGDPSYSVGGNVNWFSHYGKQSGGGGLVAKVKSLSCVRLFATPWTIAHQAPPSMRFSRQEYWSGLPFPSPGDLPNAGIEPWSPAL